VIDGCANRGGKLIYARMEKRKNLSS